MNNLVLFESFAKGKTKSTSKSLNCVIYTRVSSKEQADTNMSLETQRKYCEQFAQKSGFTIMGHFGGTYESAKTDERKEFNKMLALVKKSNQKISSIIVYSVDRFSRSGANAIYITEQLKKQGVSVHSVTQPTDSTTPSGSLQQNIQFIFSEYDNQLRREKCMTGVKEALLRGEWCNGLPLGYDSFKHNGKREIVVNEKGKLLRKAFLWKANEGASNAEIVERLQKLGWNIRHQRISNVFKNAFYCGLLSHNALEGQLVEGKHEKLVSKEVFLRANEIQSLNHHGYKNTEANDNIPLKRFLRCKDCSVFMRGYIVRKKKIHYYKCNTPGCKNNKSAKSLHKAFERILQPFTIITSEAEKELIRKQMIAMVNEVQRDDIDTNEILLKELQELNKQIDRLEERFITEEITKELYVKYTEKYKQDRVRIEQTLTKTESKGSNFEDKISLAIDLTLNLPVYWASADYSVKQKIQFMVFPEGITYNRQKDECRTLRINQAFLHVLRLKQELTQQKSGIAELNLDYAALVELEGVEPSSGDGVVTLSSC